MVLLINPGQEFHGIFSDAWRLERDYFYNRNMQGVDWTQTRDRYLPLVDRVSDRDELNDVISQMVSELSTLYTFVIGGDARKPSDDIDLGTLGVRPRRDEKAGGFLVEPIYGHDPDLPNLAPPLARPESIVHEGEIITTIDGADALSVSDEWEMLRGKAGKQVLLRVKSRLARLAKFWCGPSRRATKPTCATQSGSIPGTSRLKQLRAITSAMCTCAPWVRTTSTSGHESFIPYPIVRDSSSTPATIRAATLSCGCLQAAPQGMVLLAAARRRSAVEHAGCLRGHIVVLCDQETASDGEALAEGFKHFHLGEVMGTRTWGDEIWLSGSNVQADNGIATAAETGVYGPEGKWLIEGHGVDPDVVVDNPPHAAAAGADAQLQTALDLLQREMQA